MARRNVIALIRDAGFTRIANELVCELRQQGHTDEWIYSLVTDNEEILMNAVAGSVFEVPHRHRLTSNIYGVFQIILEGNATTSELVRRGRYDAFERQITDRYFPIAAHDPMRRTIEGIELDHAPTYEEVLEEFHWRALERPTYEDALYFGIQYPEEQRKRSIVFPQDPALHPHGYRGVLTLFGSSTKRELRIGLFDSREHRNAVFAGVRQIGG